MGLGSQRGPDSVRPAAVAGRFYPGREATLRQTVRSLLDSASPSSTAPPRAVIAPHAGYVYSGPIAASAFSTVASVRDRARRILLLGPSHFVPVRGLALSRARAFSTPLGEVAVDVDACASAAEHPAVGWMDAAHAREHSLEVELPFLQEALDEVTLVPVVVGEARPSDVAEVIGELWTDETLVVVSTDLSHFLPYEEAVRTDSTTAENVERCDFERIGPAEACGCRSLAGLLFLARERGLTVERLDVRNSGDTAGERGRVVGYGAFSIH